MSKNTSIADLINYISVDGSGNIVLSSGILVGYVPTSRTITINGTTLDLSADRSFTVSAGISGSGSSGQIAFWNGASSMTGVSNLFWDNSNIRLGIGLNNPQRRLEIYSTTADSHLRLSGSAPSVSLGESITGSIYQAKFGLATANGQYATGAVAGDFVIIAQTGATIFSNGSSTLAKLSSTGDLGIGTTAPLSKLQVVGTGTILRLGEASGSTGKQLIFGVDATTGRSEIQSVWQGNSNTPLSLNPTNGNVLIGTTTDNGSRLNVNGLVTATRGSFNPSFIAIGSSAGNGQIQISNSSNYVIGAGTDYGGMSFTIGGGERLNILNSGAATFSSSVTANGVRSINGGVDGNYQDAFVGVYSGNNNEQNAIQTAVSSIAQLSGFRFQVSNGAGSTGRTSMLDITRSGTKFQNGSSYLNYYEEGNWTPQLTAGGTPFQMGGINAGKYIRIGNQVTVNGHLQWLGGSASGMVSINGLPFTSSGVRTAGSIGAVGSGISFNSGYGQWILVNDPSTSFIYIIQQESDGSGYSHTPPVSSSGIIYGFSITYFIL